MGLVALVLLGDNTTRLFPLPCNEVFLTSDTTELLASDCSWGLDDTEFHRCCDITTSGFFSARIGVLEGTEGGLDEDGKNKGSLVGLEGVAVEVDCEANCRDPTCDGGRGLKTGVGGFGGECVGVDGRCKRGAEWAGAGFG